MELRMKGLLNLLSGEEQLGPKFWKKNQMKFVEESN